MRLLGTMAAVGELAERTLTATRIRPIGTMGTIDSTEGWIGTIDTSEST